MKYCRKQDVVARSVAGVNLLVPVHRCTNKVYTLNGTGQWLWDLIAEAKTEDELAESLVGQYDISEHQARTDVRAFLDDMVRMGLADSLE